MTDNFVTLPRIPQLGPANTRGIDVVHPTVTDDEQKTTADGTMRGSQVVEKGEQLQRLPTPVVFDHMGRLPQPAPLDHGAYKIIRAMLDKGSTWMKLSGAYLDTK